MGDLWNQYRDGLHELLDRLGQDHPSYTEVLVLQQRLLENLARARLYGDTQTSRAERIQLLDALNRLSLETVGKTFSKLFPTEFGDFVRDTTGHVVFCVREPIIIGSSNLTNQVLETTREASNEALSDFHQVIEFYKQAIITARKQGDRQIEALYLKELGLIQSRLADIEHDQRQDHLSHAADALYQATELFDALGAAPLLRARTRYHLGRCYHRLGRWREAITSLEQAREAFSHHKARPELAHTLLELGQLHHLTHDFESAYIYLKDALRLFRRLKDTDGIAVTQEALGSLALQTARLSEAITSLQEARRGYVALRRDERVRAVDGLLHIAQQAHQSAGNRGVTL